MNLFPYKLNSMFTQKSLKGGSKNYLPTELSKHPDPCGQGAFLDLQHLLRMLKFTPSQVQSSISFCGVSPNSTGLSSFILQQ